MSPDKKKFSVENYQGTQKATDSEGMQAPKIHLSFNETRRLE
jgi:hypothetical protein